MEDIVTKQLSDKLSTVDNLQQDFAKGVQPKTFRTSISATDEFGNVLFTEEENETVLGGAITVMEKLWGIRSPLQVATINEIMDINANMTIDPTSPLIQDDIVCLWGIGTGGSGDAFGSIRKVNFYEREVGQNGQKDEMIPFRVTQTQLTGDDAKKYHLMETRKDGLFAYYLKDFEIAPQIKVLWKDGAEGEDGSEVESDVHNTRRTDLIEAFVEMHLKLSKKDVREWFDVNGNIQLSRINTIALFTGRKVEIAPGVFDYINVKMFSKLNLDNEPLTNTKEINFTYRIYLS